MGRLLTETIGKIATLLGFDGTNFSALRVDTTGRLKVRGEDQLFSYQGSVAERSLGVPSGAGGYRESDTPPAGTVWIITQITGGDDTTATTVHQYRLLRGGAAIVVYEARATYAIGQKSNLSCHIVMIPGDTLRLYITGSLAPDSCCLDIHGYSMTIAV